MKYDNAGDLERPLKVTSGTVNGFSISISEI